MNETELIQYITGTFEGVDFVVASDNHFFFYNPDSTQPPDHRFPFVTLVTSDDSYDQFSNLNRPGVFRLNIGVSKQTFRSLLGTPNLPDPFNPAQKDTNFDTYDFTVLDQLMPHPVYGRMYWVSILNPTSETFTTRVQPLLVEAYEMAVSKYKRKHSPDEA